MEDAQEDKTVLGFYVLGSRRGQMKAKDEDLQKLAEAVKEVFRDSCGEFSPSDFIQVAGLLGFHAFEKGGSGETLKPVAENYFPDIIGTNLQYAV